MTAPFVPIGRAVKVHGLTGEVSVKELTALPLSSFVGLTVWLVPPPVGMRTSRIEAVRPGPKGPLVRLAGVDHVSMAVAVAGCELSVAATDLPAGWDDDVVDPVGWLVDDETRGRLGEVVDVIVTGANDVWVVEGDRFGQVLLPVIDDVILDVDEDAGVVMVRLLPGLIEED